MHPIHFVALFGLPFLLLDLRPVVGMHRGVESVQGGDEVLGVVAEDAIDLVGPEDLAGHQIRRPVPERGQGLRLQQLLLAFGQGLFGPLAIVDILHHADHAHRPALGIPLYGPALEQPAHAAVRQDDPMFDRVRRVMLERRLDRPGHRLAVVRVDRLDEVLVAGLQFALRIPEQGPDPFGPEKGSSGQVPLPGPDIRVDLPAAQALLGGLRLRLGLPAFGNVGVADHHAPAVAC